MLQKILIFTLITIGATSCFTLENKEEKWAKKHMHITECISNYPILADLLNAQLTDAKEEYDKSLELTDREDKKDQIDIAILKLSIAPYKNVYEFEDAIDNTKNIINKINAEFSEKEKSNRIKAMIEYASDKIEAAKKIQEKEFSNASIALQEFKNNTKLLEDELQDLEMVYSEVMNERQRVKDSTINANAQLKAREDTSTNILE